MDEDRTIPVAPGSDGMTVPAPGEARPDAPGSDGMTVPVPGVTRPDADAASPTAASPDGTASDGAGDLPMPDGQDAGDALPEGQVVQTGASVSVSEETGGVVLTGPMTIRTGDGDGGRSVVSVERAVVTGVYQYGKDWEVRDGASVPGRRLTVSGGSLRWEEDGSVTISGVTGDAVTLDMAPVEETVLVDYAGTLPETGPALPPLPVLAGIGVLALIALAALLGALRRPRRRERAYDGEDTGPVRLVTAKAHHIGKRPSQQDSLTVEEVPGGVFAAVADGMGGLADGDKVSQEVIYVLLNDLHGRSAAQIGDDLLPMVSRANAAVCRSLGPAGQYRSGSTLVTVAAERHQFRWASVGDSRVYLYRNSGLIQLNREHVYEADLLLQAVARGTGFDEARSHPQRAGLTSFIGMGDLRYVDASPRPVAARRGDRILLMSDGAFRALSEEEIAGILDACPSAPDAAAALERAVLERDDPHQDNLTAVLIDYV